MQYPHGVYCDQNSRLPKSWPRLSAFKNALAANAHNRLLDSSVNLFDSWTSASAATWHTTARHTSFWHATATCCLIYLHHDGVDDAFDFLLLCLELILFGQLVLVEP